MLYILYGEDDYSLHKTLEDIKKGLGDRSLLEINTITFDSKEMTAEQLKSACDTIPFMAPKRLVIVNGLLERFESKERTTSQKKRNNTNNTRQGELEQIVDCISHVPDTTVLILIDGTKIKATNRLLKELSGKAEVKEFTYPKGRNLHQWVKEYVAGKDATISSEAINLMVELVGSNLWIMAGELDKLILFAPGRVITEEDVKAVVSHAREFNVFDMVDAILEFNSSRAGQSLQQLLLEGESAVSLLVRLSRQFQRIFLVREMKSRGIPDTQIKSKLGINAPYFWQKVQGQANRYSLERLKNIYQKLLETDLAIKTGKYNDELALNLLISELCQRNA